MSLTLKEKMELYKTAKKPRREIRLRFEAITNGLELPKVALCENRVAAVFKINEVAKIEPQINSYAERYRASQERLPTKPPVNLELQRLKNRLNCLKVANMLENKRFRLNVALREIGKNMDHRSDELMRGSSDFME